MIFVFAYGSLMWNPGFRAEESHAALLTGWRRSWCVKSAHYRGCDERPGYVLGLKRGGSCVGVVHRLHTSTAAAVLEDLDRREMREPGYVRQSLSVELPDRIVQAFVYTTESLAEPCAQTLRTAFLVAEGKAGANRDYVINTVACLKSLPRPERWPEPDTALPGIENAEIALFL